jgi:tripartite ATP-independent transporter DctM subunit
VNLLVYSLVIILLLFLRVPVAFAFLAPSLVYLVLAGFPLGAAIQQITYGIDSFVLLAVPLFLLMGNLVSTTGLAERLYAFILALLGRFRGSLGYVNVVLSLMISLMSGVAVADAAVLSKIAIPQMRRAGYPLEFSAGLTAASSLIGPIMPPSLPAVIYAVIAGVSLGAMLAAGVLPALVISALLAAYVFIWARSRPELTRQQASLAELASTARAAFPAMLTPVILLGGILGGVVTPTEASGVAVFYVLLLTAIYRTLTLRQLVHVLRQTAETTGVVLLIVAASQFTSYILALEQAPVLVGRAFQSLTTSPIVFLIMLNVALLILGIFFEVSAMLVVLAALIIPVASTYGVDRVQLGVILIFNFLLGSVSPPVGLILSVISAALKIPLGMVNRGVIPFFIPLTIALAAITFYPPLSTWLPGVMGLGR